MSSLTDDQLETISIMERTCSVVSLLGCLFTVITFISFGAFREKPVNRLVFFASLGNMCSNVGTLMSVSFLHNPDSFGCQFQAMVIQWFMAVDVAWILAMAINVYLTVYQRYDLKRLHRMELIYLPCCYGIPFIPAFTYIFVTHNGKRIYGDAVLWCWISGDFETLRLASFYAPVWGLILITFTIYICAARTIFTIRKQVHELSSDNDLSSFASTEVTTINGSGVATTLHGDVVVSVETQVVYEQTTAVHVGRRGRTSSASQSRFARRRSYEHKNAAWSYSKCALLYFTAILITWIPASANRVYSLTHKGRAVPTVAYMSALVLPLQGLWNCIIYMVMSWSACKELGRKTKARVKGLFKKRPSEDPPIQEVTEASGAPRLNAPPWGV